MTTPGKIIPVLRIFDEHKAREFYIDFLEADVIFEHRYEDNFPLYAGIVLHGAELHLSEHHGDASPGAQVRIQTNDIQAFIDVLAAKNYKYAKPGSAHEQPWGTLETTLTDPFGNRLTFYQIS